MPFLSPNQQHQSTEGSQRHSTLLNSGKMAGVARADLQFLATTETYRREFAAAFARQSSTACTAVIVE